MATKLNPTKPFVFLFNQTNVENEDSEYFSNQSFYVTAGRYYYYSVYLYDLSTRVYSGKTWSYTNENGEIEIEINVQDILKAYSYNSWHLMRPVYNAEEQRNQLFYVTNGSVVNTFDNRPEMKNLSGVGIAKVYVLLFGEYTERISDRLCGLQREFTSSWNISQPVYNYDDNFTYFQDLLTLEFPGFVSHYPKTMTDKFSISWLMNVALSWVGNTADAAYRFGNVNTTDDYLTVYHANTNTSSAKSGYVPFNITLEDIIPYLQTVYSPAQPFEEIIGATASQTIYEHFNTGTSSAYTPSNTWVGGNSNPHSPAIASVNETNSVFVWPSDNFSEKIQIAELDECPKKYYLKWQTKSGCPACYGFDGNTVESKSYKVTSMVDNYRRNFPKINEIENKWELKSGIITKGVYYAMEDIFTSPYLILYSVEENESWFVTIEDSEYKKKKSIKEDKQPFNLTINVKQADQTKLIF